MTGIAIAEVTESPRLRWLRDRQQGIGGSDAAATVGLSPWVTPYDLYLDKTEPIADTEPSEPMLWGTLLEPVIRQRYCDVTGRTVVVPSGMFRHPEYDWCLATLDGHTVDGERIFEAKTGRDSEGWGDAGSDEVPDHYALQVQHYMAVTGIGVTDVAVLFGGSDFRIYTVDADSHVQSMLLDAEAEFWERVQRRDPPDPVTAGDVRRRWRRASIAGMVDAEPDDVAAWEELLFLRGTIADLETEKETLETKLKSRIRDSEGIQADGKPLATWKNAKGAKRFDVSRFKTEHPDLFDLYLTESEGSRRFLLKQPKASK